MSEVNGKLGSLSGQRLIRLDEALTTLDSFLEVVALTEEVPVDAASGRVLREDVCASIDVPGHTNSAVDGYALRFADVAPNCGDLRVVARSVAGSQKIPTLGTGEAIQVFTGAPLPEGADTVVMQEHCRVSRRRVAIPAEISVGANRRLAGEDVRAGQAVLRAGRHLSPADLGLAAAVGRRAVKVSRPLRVAVLSSGDELKAVGERLEPGTIYDANRVMLLACLRQIGCEVVDLGFVEDSRVAGERVLEQAAQSADLIVSTGGVSVGEEDHMKQAVVALGAIDQWRLAIKPGKPVAIGRVRSTPFLGLPGNPAAATVTAALLMRPMISKLLGGRAYRPSSYPLPASSHHQKKPGRREFLRGRLVKTGDTVSVEAHPRQGSGMLSPFSDSDGLIEIPEDTEEVQPGMRVDFLPFAAVWS